METDLGLIIQLYIRENGGVISLARKIESEWSKDPIPHYLKWSLDEEKYILLNYNTKTCVFIASKLKRSYFATRQKIWRMREVAILNYRKTKRENVDKKSSF